MAQTLDELSIGVEEVSRQYSSYINAVSGNFFYATSVSATMKDLSNFRKRAWGAREAALYAIESALNKSSEAMQARAFDIAKKSGVRFDEEMKEGVSGLSDMALMEIFDSIARQMTRDQRGAELDLKRLILSSSAIKKSGNGQTVESSLIGAKKMTRLAYIDKSGKKWKSERFVRYTSRMGLIGILSDAVSVVGAASGKKTMVLSGGKTLKLSEYDGLKSKYFHPNTKLFPVSIK